ncbi:MAG: hypothetical protein JXA14_08345 [Anaerolineae bacterium]|nr:hypothetical protein [Anaerolineae bacterium]
MLKVSKAIHAARLGEHAPPITAFNIEARYPDLKRAFRQQCTREYTQRQLADIQEVFTWLRSLLL